MSEYLIFTVVFSCSYDCVYASPEQRVAGGGCLDLTRMVEEELGLEEGAITGTWDIAHNLQIVWKNGLSEHEAVEELIQLIFNTMDDYRVGQSRV